MEKNTIMDSRNWRYATKKFDPDRKVENEDLDYLLEAARLTPSSFGLQPYHFVVVSDPEVRERLRKESWDQAQITDSSYVIVLAHQVGFGDGLVDRYIGHAKVARPEQAEKLDGYGGFVKEWLGRMDAEGKAQWARRQAYIALGNLMQAAAELKIDTCPIEGFDPEGYNRILGLPEKGLGACVVMALGYRSESDATQHAAKVRFPKEELFTFV